MKKRLRTTKKIDRPRLALSTEKTVVSSRIEDYVILIYGVPKIGKTSFTGQFEGSKHFFFGDRNVSLELCQEQVEDWEQAEEFVELWRKSKFRNAVIDVTEIAYEMCFDYLCDGKLVDMHGTRVDHPALANDRGRAWKIIRRRFSSWVERLCSTDKGVIFVSHSKLGERKTSDGDVIEDIHPALSGQCAEIVVGKADVVGYYKFEKGERVLQIRGDADVMAGCRCRQNFRHTDGSPVVNIPMGNSEEEAYENFLRAFRNELPPPVVEKKTSLRRKVRK